MRSGPRTRRPESGWIGFPSLCPRIDWNCPHDQRTVCPYHSRKVWGSIVHDRASWTYATRPSRRRTISASQYMSSIA